ncbi:hypothetical protein SeLEV6574_g06346 [Synchytrium endobioticum]|nr:hypothetical protein SeLEV6574_g06346 [Synchytrium endobioticum]
MHAFKRALPTFNRTTTMLSQHQAFLPKQLLSRPHGVDSLPSAPQYAARMPKSLHATNQCRLYSTSVKPSLEQRIHRADGRKKKGIRAVGADENAASPTPLTSTTIQKATAFCTAEEYNVDILLPLLQRHYTLQPYITDFVYHFKLGITPSPHDNTISSSHSDGAKGPTPDAFFFEDGTFVTWGATPEQNELLLLQIKDAQVNTHKVLETEFFDFFEDPEQACTIVGDSIVIGADMASHQAKLAFSSGMARSAKLGALEALLDTHLSKNRNIPTILLSGRKLPLTRTAVLQNLGELFALRGSLNLHNELLDSPDFLWSSTKMERLFDRISKNLDVVPRIAVFNKKLDYANELAEVLRNHLHEQHSLKLEWCIIVLIAIEIAFELVHYAERLGYVDLDVFASKGHEGKLKLVELPHNAQVMADQGPVPAGAKA